MKQTIALLSLLAFSSASFAQTVISCEGTGGGGSLFKSVQLDRKDGSYVVNSVDYDDNSNEIKVLSISGTPTSTKYVLETSTEMKKSLVVAVGTQQAVMMYEAGAGEQSTTAIEFLKCR